MQMHYRFNVKHIGLNAINDRVWKTTEIEFAIFAANFTPPFGLRENTPECAFKLVKKVISQTRFPFLVPQGSGFEFFGCFRMADDAHGALSGCPEQLSPLAGR
jgi:hypothetical protein